MDKATAAMAEPLTLKEKALLCALLSKDRKEKISVILAIDSDGVQSKVSSARLIDDMKLIDSIASKLAIELER